MTGKLDGQRIAAGGLAAAILDSAHALVVTLDIEGRIIGFNRACELLSGYKADEVIGTPIWDKLLPKEAAGPIRQFFAGLPEGREVPEEHENAWLTRDGRRPIIAWNNSVMRNAAGEIDAIVGVGVDITERKAANDRLARAQRIAQIGSWERTVGTGNGNWSDQYYINLGLEPGSVKPSVEEFYRHVHPGDHGDIRRKIQNAVEAKYPYSADFRVIWPDGTERLVHEQGEPILDDDGKVIALAGIMQDITELRETENRLQRLTHSFANAQRMAGIGNWDWDAITKVEWWSDEVYRILGLEPGAIEPGYDSFMSRTHPDDREKVGQAIETAQRQLTSYDITFRVITPDGDERVVREVSECVLDSLGRLAGLSGTVQDITAQYSAEQALADTAKRLEAAIRLAKLGSWEWDPDSNRLKNSPETLRICGLNPDSAEVDNEFLMAMIPVEEHANVLGKMNSAVSSGLPYTNEYHIVRPDGDIRTVLEHGEPYHDEATGRTRLVGTIQDVTERKRAEEELARTVKRLADAQTAAQIGNWEWDAATDMDWWSEQQSRNYGIEAPARFVPGDYFLQFVHPADRESARQAVDDSVASGTVLDLEFRSIGADGIERMMWVYGVAETDVDGRVIRTIGTTQDITERKHAERELTRTSERLEEAQRIAHIGHWEWRSDTSDFFWSPSMYRLFGLEPDAMRPTDDSFMKSIHDEDRAPLQELMAHTIETGEPYETEFRIRRPDGEWMHIFERAEQYIDEETRKPSIRGVMQDITERKRGELALQETKSQMEEAQRLAQTGSWSWEPEENIISGSDQYCRIFGLEPGSATFDDSSFLEHVHPEDRDRVRKVKRASTNRKEPFSVEYRIVHSDGTERMVLEQGEWVEGDGSHKPQWRGVLQDITEQRETETQLRQLATRLDNAQRVARIGNWEWDAATDNEWWSDQCYRLLGHQPGDVESTNDNFFAVMHPDDRKRVKVISEAAEKSLKPYEFNCRIILRDGTERVVREVGYPAYDKDGKFVGQNGTIQDITEQIAAEQALRDSEARLNAFFTEAPAGLAIVDKDYRYVRLNNMLARMNNLSVEDHIGKRPSDILPAEMADLVENGMRRTLEGGEAIDSEEGSAPALDGRIHSWVFSQFPIAGDPRQPDALGIVIVDVTELKNVQQELARLNAELEQRVEDRTAELRAAQAELVKNERLATLGQLTATVSHELRNPLGSMRTSMYVVEKKTDAQDQRLRASIDRVNRNITRCDQIIDELLDYTRIRDLDLRQTDLDRWLGAILDEQDTPSKVTVKRKFGTKGARIPFDSDRLRRAIVNVFENACHAAAACAHRKALVSIETSLRKDRVQITVSDNGAGIPPEIREKIFEPLFSTKNFGVGLGLPTVRQIMEQHGGGIEIGEGLDGGAKFALWLPLAEEPEIADK